jgi:hypothetical protein
MFVSLIKQDWFISRHGRFDQRGLCYDRNENWDAMRSAQLTVATHENIQ